jgi:uncharacterized membrane protein required for colicin V production
MIIQLVVIVLILAFAFFQMKQGLFNALIMGVCSFFSAILAMTTYRWLADTTNLYGALPLLAEPGCIGLIFFVSLIATRYLAEKFIPGNIIFNVIIERIGASICGLFSGTIFVGMLLLVTLMLPLGENVFGYQQYNDDLMRDKTLAPFCPDDFIISLGQLASTGSETPLMQGNNDILLNAFCNRNTAGKNGLTKAKKDDFKITNLTLWKKPTVKVPQYPLPPKAGKTQVWVIRAEISNSTANPEDNWWRLPATQFKLIAKKQNGTEYTYYPVGYLYVSKSSGNWTLEQGPNGGKSIAKLIVGRPDPTKVVTRRRRRGKKRPEKHVEIKLNVDWVFRIPTDVTPEAVVFRHSVTAKVPKANSRLSLKFKSDALRENPVEKKKKR